MPLIGASGLLGLLVPAPERFAVDHAGINTVLVILVLASAATVPAGAGGRLRSSATMLALVLVLTTIALATSAWIVSHLVSNSELAHGVLALGVAPTEIATIALTALAASDVAITAALLVSSTVVSVVIAGPILAFEAGGRVNASSVLVDLTLIVALPMVVGLAGRRLAARSARLMSSVEPVSMVAVVVLVALVASQVRLTRDYVIVAFALVCFIALSTARGIALSRLAPGRERAAIALSISIRDFAIASGIATSAFGAVAAGPLGLYGMLVIGWGALLARLLRGSPQVSP